MSTRLLCLGLRFCCAATLGVVSTAPAQPPSHIRVWPNVLVSRDPDVPRTEPHLAASPTDPRRLVAMTTVLRDSGSGRTLELYRSADGGQSWTGTLAQNPLGPAGDPVVAFTPTGAALAVGILGWNGRLWGYRSEDGGLTWDAGRRVGGGDHERMGVDWTSGAYAGRAYVAAEVRQDSGSSVQVWRSTDDGRSWSAPVTVAVDSLHGFSVSSLMVLGDGSVTLIFETYPNYRADSTTTTWGIHVSSSTDGGMTWSAPKQVGTQAFGGFVSLRRRHILGRPGMANLGFEAVAYAGSGRHGERLYAAYAEFREARGGSRIAFASSTDNGQTWNRQDMVPPSSPEVSQFQPAIAVTPDGVIGVLWCETHGATEAFDVYFSSSVDDGRSWLPRVRVSSATSTPFTAANVRPVSEVVAPGTNGVSVYIESPYSRWPDGGDYMGLAADAAGTFHPLWPDARTGVFQLYTTRIDVSRSEFFGRGPEGSRGPERSLAGKATLQLDPARVDWTRSELLVPVRIRNTSSDTLYGPLSIELTQLTSDWETGTNATQIVNASNGKHGKGARVDYAGSLRGLPWLPPGAVTEAVVWRVHPASMRHTNLSITAHIRGRTGS